jgi:hypothetical protein
MSTENVQNIIGRAIVEAEYRSLLFDNPEKALEGYELTQDEAKSLKSLDRERFDEVASQVEERISKSGLALREIGMMKNELNLDLRMLFQH